MLLSLKLGLLSWVDLIFSMVFSQTRHQRLRYGFFFWTESEHHNSNEYYPMLAQALGRDAIYFDYVTSVNRALDDATYLNQFDALLLYANHPRLSSTQWKNLLSFVRSGKGFVPFIVPAGVFQIFLNTTS